MEDAHPDGLIVNNKSTAPESLNVSAFDPSAIYWTYGVLGRRLLFRPIFRTGYRDAEDYYQKSYDPVAGIRVAVALGSLMLLICGIAIYNRYGFFRKRRKLHVSLRSSKEQLEGLEWLRVIELRDNSLVYNPVCSDQDLPKIPPAPPKDQTANRSDAYNSGPAKLKLDSRTISVTAVYELDQRLELKPLSRSSSC